MTELIVFLGNPGSQYRHTRHNAAWIFLEHLPLYKTLKWQKKFKGEFAAADIEGRSRLLLRPLVYMNRSGESIQALTLYYKIQFDKILVVHDEIELDFGRVQIKRGGGLAGHNGLRSVSSSLGTRDFARLRIGIGRPERMPVNSYVLGRFTDEEKTMLPRIFESAGEQLFGELQNPTI